MSDSTADKGNQSTRKLTLKRDTDKSADFYVSYTRSRCHERFRWAPEMFRLERMNTMLFIARDLRGGRDANTEEEEEAQ